MRFSDSSIFPKNVQEILKALYSIGFFESSILIGSWVILLYKEPFGIDYSLRTLDIDFGVVSTVSPKARPIDPVFTELGFIEVLDRSGASGYTKAGLSVDFLVHRKGGKTKDVLNIPQWELKAIPVPYINLMFEFTFQAEFDEFKVRAPLPEAYFTHKMIIAQRRVEPGKKEKDLDQCSIIAEKLNEKRLQEVINSVPIGPGTRKNLRASCKAIGFSTKKLGLKD